MSPYVFDASAENFASLVLDNSMRGPVLVHFWSGKAAPCFIVMPRLVRLATEYGGRFLLVMFNTDELGALARQYGVTSVPTSKLFMSGEVVGTIHGAQPDGEFRALLDRFVTRESDLLHAAAVAEYQAGRVEQAFELFAQGRAQDPQNLRLVVDHAKLLMLEGQLDEARELLANLPERVRNESAIANLTAHIELLAAVEPDTSVEAIELAIADAPDDSALRFKLAATALLHDDYDKALSALTEIVRRDRGYRDDLARRAMIAIFDLLGNQGPLVARYRTLLFSLLRA